MESGQKLSSKKCQEVSDLLKPLAHPQRLGILCLLTEGEKTVQRIMEAMDLCQPTVSHHLILMKKDGLLECRREGKNIFYWISQPEIKKVMKSLYKIFCG